MEEHDAPEVPRPRRCDRPGCALAATSILSFDGGTGQVRIQRLRANPPPLTLVLCTTHTDRLVVPRGWVLQDERDEGHLFAAEDGPGETTPDGGDTVPAARPAKPRAPRKRAAKRAPARARQDDPEGDAAVRVEPVEGEAGGAPPAPELARPALFATAQDADPPPPPALPPPSPALPPETLTRAPEERRLLHRAFRAASTRETSEPDPEP